LFRVEYIISAITFSTVTKVSVAKVFHEIKNHQKTDEEKINTRSPGIHRKI